MVRESLCINLLPFSGAVTPSGVAICIFKSRGSFYTEPYLSVKDNRVAAAVFWVPKVEL